MLLMIIQRSIEKEEVGDSIDKGYIIQVQEIRQMNVILKEFVNLVNLIVLSSSFHYMWEVQFFIKQIQASNNEDRAVVGGFEVSCDLMAYGACSTGCLTNIGPGGCPEK